MSRFTTPVKQKRAASPKSATMWYIQLHGKILLVCHDEKLLRDSSPQKVWKVRAITWRAAGRRLLRGGTIAEHIAKREYEWDFGHGCTGQGGSGSLADDREKPLVKNMVKEITIERFK